MVVMDGHFLHHSDPYAMLPSSCIVHSLHREGLWGCMPSLSLCAWTVRDKYPYALFKEGSSLYGVRWESERSDAVRFPLSTGFVRPIPP